LVVGSGEVSLSAASGDVSYRLDLREMICASGVASFVLGAAMLMLGFTFPVGFGTAIGSLAFLVVGNWVMVRIRFPLFVKRCFATT
jgi:hypothetical protein